MLEIVDCPKPVIASVQSYCLAGGTDLMLACDLAVVADDAKFGYVDIRFGSGVVSMFLPWVVGVRKAKELLFTGEDRVAADEALRIGLVNRVVPRDELDDATLALAEEIAKNESFVVQMTKRALNRAWDVAGFRAALAANTELDVIIETTNLPTRDEFRRITAARRPEGRDRLARREVPRRGLSAVRWDLRPLLAPRSIAIVGASESPDSWAPEIERSLRHIGYTGELYPINPKYDTVWGRPCLSSIGELPRGVDLVVFVVPARVVVRMIDDCGARGVRGIMVVSSGFAEAGEEGRALQAELRAAALRTKIPVLGPNVEGFVNYVDQVAPYGTTPPAEPVKGGISVISQSGTVAWTMNQIASDRAVGLRIILGVGNEAVLGLGDLFAWAAADPKTKVVTSYIETMRDVEGIGRGLDALLAARKPVADLRAGGPVGGGAAVDHRAHRRARRQHRAARRVAPWPRGRARRGPGHDVRDRAAAVPREEAADRRRGRGAAVRRGVHAVRRGRGRRPTCRSRSSRPRPRRPCARRCPRSRRRTTRST